MSCAQLRIQHSSQLLESMRQFFRASFLFFSLLLYLSLSLFLVLLHPFIIRQLFRSGKALVALDSLPWQLCAANLLHCTSAPAFVQ